MLIYTIPHPRVLRSEEPGTVAFTPRQRPGNPPSVDRTSPRPPQVWPTALYRKPAPEGFFCCPFQHDISCHCRVERVVQTDDENTLLFLIGRYVRQEFNIHHYTIHHFTTPHPQASRETTPSLRDATQRVSFHPNISKVYLCTYLCPIWFKPTFCSECAYFILGIYPLCIG